MLACRYVPTSKMTFNPFRLVKFNKLGVVSMSTNQLAERFRLWILVPILVQLPEQGRYPTSSTPTVLWSPTWTPLAFRSEEWWKWFNRVFHTSRQPTLHLFPYKMLFSPWSCFTKKLRVAFASFEMNVNIQFNASYLLLCYQRRNTRYKNLKYNVFPTKFILQELHNQYVLNTQYNT
jgi:hypothetical protein